jgi:hypothetical protein
MIITGEQMAQVQLVRTALEAANLLASIDVAQGRTEDSTATHFARARCRQLAHDAIDLHRVPKDSAFMHAVMWACNTAAGDAAEYCARATSVLAGDYSALEILN